MKVIPETSEENISVSYGCIRITDIHQFFSGCSDELARSFEEIKQKSLKNLREEFPDNEIKRNKIREIEFLMGIIKYENEPTEKLKKEFRDEVEKMKGISIEVLSENTPLKFMKNQFCDNCRFLWQKLSL